MTSCGTTRTCWRTSCARRRGGDLHGAVPVRRPGPHGPGHRRAAARPWWTPSGRWLPARPLTAGQFYGAEGTFALLEKDDLDYGVIGNPTKATKEKGDKLVEAVVEGYSELIKELLETHPVGKNPLGASAIPWATTASTAAPIPPSTRTTTRRADPPTTRNNSSIQSRQKDFPFFCLLWLSEDARFQVCSADSPLFSQRDV